MSHINTLSGVSKYSRTLYMCALLCVISYISQAQLVVNGNQTATVLANTLVGPGITISAPTLTCFYKANGTFTTTVVNPIGIANGIVLTTGSAVDSVVFPGDTTYGVAHPSLDFADGTWGMPGDADLSAAAGGEVTQDACVLEFDLTPAGDTMKFNYVFGSEEYTDFTCTGFNDVFGFFITGGAYSTPTNLALVPGTTIPVCINSVNCGPGAGFGSLSTCTALGPGSPFCAYYIDNTATTSIASPYVVYDGLTTVLQAIAAVDPCTTYHLKLAIADGVDDAYDSGVFIEGGSLTSTGISITPVGINPADTGFGAQYCVRECTPGEFVFHATGSLVDTTVIHYTIGGTAVNGYDYTTIPDSVIILPGDSTYTLYITGLAVPPAGPKTVELYIYSAFTCGGAPVILDSAEITIYDSLFVKINTPDTAICLGQSVVINTSGFSSLTYNWSPAATLNSSTLLSPTAAPSVTTTYTVTASYPGSGCAPSMDVITVVVTTLATLNIGPPVQSICVGSPLQLNVSATPFSPVYTYNWTPAANLNNPAIADPIVTPATIADQEYYVTVGSSVPGCMAIDSFLLHVLPNDFTLTSPDTNICFSTGPFQVIASGDSEFTYRWTPVAGVSNPDVVDPVMTPFGSTTYVITASYPGCPNMVHSITYSIQDPNVNILIGDTTFCIGSTIPIPVTVTPADSAYTFSWSTPTTGLSDPTIIDPDFFVTASGTYTYYLTIQSSYGCTSTDSITFNASPPISISILPGNTTIPYGSSIQLNAVNLTPATSLFYQWYPDDGTLDNTNINNPMATPLDSTTYIVVAMNTYGCRDTASEIIGVDRDMSETMPLAFTPNNDGLNDVFRIINIHYQKLVEFAIFNRWGQKVYENDTDPKKGWDGTFNGVPQDMGVYNYVVIVATGDGDNKTYTGTVTLIR